MQTAKVFMNGRSQAVRLPAAFRFDVNEVFIRKNEHGEIVLSPKPNNWDSFFALGSYDEEVDFSHSLGEDVREIVLRDPFENWQE